MGKGGGNLTDRLWLLIPLLAPESGAADQRSLGALGPSPFRCNKCILKLSLHYPSRRLGLDGERCVCVQGGSSIARPSACMSCSFVNPILLINFVLHSASCVVCPKLHSLALLPGGTVET